MHILKRGLLKHVVLALFWFSVATVMFSTPIANPVEEVVIFLSQYDFLCTRPKDLLPVIDPRIGHRVSVLGIRSA